MKLIGNRVVPFALTVLGLLLLVALGAWSLRPRVDRAGADATEVMLWTPGAPEAVARVGRPLVALASLGGRPPAGADVVTDAEALRSAYPRLAHVEVVGAGVEPSELPALSGVTLAFAPSPSAGVALSQVHAPARVSVGERVVVSGTVVGLGEGKTLVLTLEAPSGAASRQELVGTGGRSVFQLDGGRAGAVGTFLWHLRIGGRTMPIGVEVVPPVRPRVLLLASRPSFEVARLQRWLVETGTPVALRTRVSAERVRVAAANGAEAPGDTLNDAVLATFDLVVADRAELRGLSAVEQGLLATAVRRGGLGVLELADAGVTHEPIAVSPWTLILSGANAEMREGRLRWPDDRVAALAASVPSAEWRVAPGDERALRDGQDRVVAVARRLGQGWVASSLVADTWRWAQAGQVEAYGAYWAEWIQRLSRPQASAAKWEVSGDGELLVVDRPVRVRWRSGTLETLTAPAARIGSVRQTPDALALVADPVAPGEATARFWPLESGWHQVRTAEDGGVERSFYVQTWSDAEPLLLAARTRATTLAAERVSRANKSPLPVLAGANATWPWLLAAALVAVWGVLWWRERAR